MQSTQTWWPGSNAAVERDNSFVPKPLRGSAYSGGTCLTRSPMQFNQGTQMYGTNAHTKLVAMAALFVG